MIDSKVDLFLVTSCKERYFEGGVPDSPDPETKKCEASVGPAPSSPPTLCPVHDDFSAFSAPKKLRKVSSTQKSCLLGDMLPWVPAVDKSVARQPHPSFLLGDDDKTSRLRFVKLICPRITRLPAFKNEKLSSYEAFCETSILKSPTVTTSNVVEALRRFKLGDTATIRRFWAIFTPKNRQDFCSFALSPKIDMYEIVFSGLLASEHTVGLKSHFRFVCLPVTHKSGSFVLREGIKLPSKGSPPLIVGPQLLSLRLPSLELSSTSSPDESLTHSEEQLMLLCVLSTGSESLKVPLTSDESVVVEALKVDYRQQLFIVAQVGIPKPLTKDARVLQSLSPPTLPLVF